jgi:hypothetical protein
MVIDFASEPEEPSWPEGIEVRPFRPGDERTSHVTHMETLAESLTGAYRLYESVGMHAARRFDSHEQTLA